MNHILVGASIPFAVACVWYAARRGRTSLRFLVLVPCTMALGALWAIVPDLPRLVGRVALHQRLTADPRCDLFFWHHTLDRIETNSIWTTPVFVLMLLGLLFAGWRTLRAAERRRAL